MRRTCSALESDRWIWTLVAPERSCFHCSTFPFHCLWCSEIWKSINIQSSYSLGWFHYSLQWRNFIHRSSCTKQWDAGSYAHTLCKHSPHTRWALSTIFGLCLTKKPPSSTCFVVSVCLKLSCIQKSPRGLITIQILIPHVWGGAQEPAFLTRSQVMLMLRLMMDIWSRKTCRYCFHQSHFKASSPFIIRIPLLRGVVGVLETGRPLQLPGLHFYQSLHVLCWANHFSSPQASSFLICKMELSPTLQWCEARGNDKGVVKSRLHTDSQVQKGSAKGNTSSAW